MTMTTADQQSGEPRLRVHDISLAFGEVKT